MMQDRWDELLFALAKDKNRLKEIKEFESFLNPPGAYLFTCSNDCRCNRYSSYLCDGYFLKFNELWPNDSIHEIKIKYSHIEPLYVYSYRPAIKIKDALNEYEDHIKHSKMIKGE